jgi:hypothetical protein
VKSEPQPCAAYRDARVELCQVGHELDGRFSLLAGQGRDAGQKIVIGETRRESEEVRIHAVYVSR